MCSKQQHQRTGMKQDNFLQKAEKLFYRAVDVTRKKGVRYVCRTGSKRIVTRLKNAFEYYYYQGFRSMRCFTFQNEPYKYFYHRYNTTWKNERTVEIPIVWQIVKKHEGESILEVGDVLSNYFSVNHDIVDKYERREGVITQDVVDFHPAKTYDLIISISTLEHVGWNENPNDHEILHQPNKVLHTIENLRALLAANGRIVVTLPLGYNPHLDSLLRNGKIRFDNQFCLKRISKDNKWVECRWQDIDKTKYGSPFHAANGLLVGIIGT